MTSALDETDVELLQAQLTPDFSAEYIVPSEGPLSVKGRDTFAKMMTKHFENQKAIGTVLFPLERYFEIIGINVKKEEHGHFRPPPFQTKRIRESPFPPFLSNGLVEPRAYLSASDNTPFIVRHILQIEF